MKLRIQGTAIRFRLNRREVAEFAATGKASAAVQFAGGEALRYTLARTAADEMSARFSSGEVFVEVPGAILSNWATSDDVGMSATVAGPLEILIEKDFQCMHKGESAKDPDAYPNPMANTSPS